MIIDNLLIYVTLMFILLIIGIILLIKKKYIIGIILIIITIPTVIVYTTLFISSIITISTDMNIWDESVKFIFNKVYNINKINYKKYDKPVIYCVNHYINDMTDHLLISYLDNSKIVANKRKNIVAKILEKNDYIEINQKGNELNKFLNECKNKINNGYNIIIFPEGKYSRKKKKWNRLEKFQSGAFILSKETGIPIVPVIFDNKCSYKGIIIPGKLNMYFLNPIYPNNKSIEELKNTTINKMNDILNKL